MLPPRIFGPILLMWGVCVVVLVWQRDLGTAGLFFAGFLVLMYAATGSIFILIAGGLMITMAAIAAYFAFDVVAQRVDIWLNPWADASGRAYQLVQSLMAFSAGGIFGEGIGQGMPIFIPVVHSDFIFAAVAEEFGLVGVAGIIASFAVLALRGMRIALARQDQPFLALMAVGLTTMIIAQSLLIMGGTLRVIPLTGVTLPLMSYGGSSLLATFVMIGLMLRLSAREP
jgi:cell division protein FtsW